MQTDEAQSQSFGQSGLPTSLHPYVDKIGRSRVVGWNRKESEGFGGSRKESEGVGGSRQESKGVGRSRGSGVGGGRGEGERV